jgi:hypothetical protein
MSWECLTILHTIKQIFLKFCMRAMSLDAAGYLPILEIFNITKPRPWSKVYLEANIYSCNQIPPPFLEPKYLLGVHKRLIGFPYSVMVSVPSSFHHLILRVLLIFFNVLWSVMPVCLCSGQWSVSRWVSLNLDCKALTGWVSTCLDVGMVTDKSL